ncbi:MAG: hypothetical protein KGQ82_07950 [Alphaproteobacteria bacterium]|nr:hypothetical protein [Alphaproteobacteria bacterium]
MQPRDSMVPQNARIPAPSAEGQIRSWIASPRGLLIGGIVVVAAGLALGWKWVVAAGFAPIILALAPCAVMCTLGMCMMGGRKSAAPLGPTGVAEQKAIAEPPPSRDSKI